MGLIRLVLIPMGKRTQIWKVNDWDYAREW